MVRDNKIAIVLNDEEYKELKERAKEAHLPLAAYCRSYLLTERKELIYATTSSRDIDIRRLNKPKPPPDPFLIEKQKTHKIFMTDVRDDLFEAIVSGQALNPPPEEIMEELFTERENRKHEVNKAMKEFERRKLAAGLI